jgi:Uncharacterized protein conserved in bacteria (DUF2066)
MALPRKLRYDPENGADAKIGDRRRFAMTPRLVSAVTGDRTGRRAAGAGLLLLAVLIWLGPTRADDPDDPYSATVKVDATADNAAAARTLARHDGQQRALMEVIEHLTGSTDQPKLPKLDDKAIRGMVDSFEVSDEKMSAVRYLANYTFHFRAAKVRQLLRSADIPVSSSSSPGKPVVVVPVFRDGDKSVLWDDPNPWRDAWAQLPAASGPTRLSVPLGGLADVSAIDATQARSGDAQALTAVAQGNNADEALVAAATTHRQGDKLSSLDISLKRYRLGQLTNSQTTSITINPGESNTDFMNRAVAAVAADIEHGIPPSSNKEASLDAIVPIASLGDWVAMQQRLAAVPEIHKVDLLSLSRQQAKIEIKYVGSADQLKSSLAGADLDLGGGDPEWRLSPSAANSVGPAMSGTHSNRNDEPARGQPP